MHDCVVLCGVGKANSLQLLPISFAYVEKLLQVLQGVDWAVGSLLLMFFFLSSFVNIKEISDTVS